MFVEKKIFLKNLCWDKCWSTWHFHTIVTGRQEDKPCYRHIWNQVEIIQQLVSGRLAMLVETSLLRGKVDYLTFLNVSSPLIKLVQYSLDQSESQQARIEHAIPVKGKTKVFASKRIYATTPVNATKYRNTPPLGTIDSEQILFYLSRLNINRNIVTHCCWKNLVDWHIDVNAAIIHAIFR